MVTVPTSLMKLPNNCQKNEIELLCLLFHASHILQPLDIGIFWPMKGYFRKRCDNYLQPEQLPSCQPEPTTPSTRATTPSTRATTPSTRATTPSTRATTPPTRTTNSTE
uniref:DDE-1 domain-containing protein n=1 Tax=Clytia hemisphaerica TaxID=252671 RepID=A0A7M5UZW1_9CNID|eukprot:TCONS_00054369-protein